MNIETNIETELDQLIAQAYASLGKQEDANKVYTALLRTQLFIPVKNIPPDTKVTTEDEPFVPLFARHHDKVFMAAFDTLERLHTWAGDQRDNMAFVQIMGNQLIRGIGNEVYLSLNIGTPHFKEFDPEEIHRLKTIVAKLDSWQRS